jgi:carboxylesterase type B
MHRAWVSFAVSGDCGWPRYDATRRRTMRFDTTPQMVDDPLGPMLALWKGVR